jgi:hypothetical protein
LRTLLGNLRLPRPIWSQHALQNRSKADRKQWLLRVAQQIDNSALGVAQKNTVAVGQQMQTGAARGEVRQSVSEVAPQKGHHPANALQAEAAASKVAEHG